MLIDRSIKPNYYLITLLVIDPDDITRSKMIELDPETVEAGVFMDKEQKIPAPISDPRYHLKPGEKEILEASPEEGGFIMLDVHGYVPVKYFDKHFLALWFEFDTFAQMLAENDFDPVMHHGRLLMVRDYSDDPRVTNPTDHPMWAIYRLEGDNPRDTDSWSMVFNEARFHEYYKWEDIPDGPRSTVEEINTMMSHTHPHFNKDVLDKLGVDENGDLTFDGIRITLRKEFNAINILTQYPYNELLVGDFGHEVTYRGDYQPTSDTDSEGRIYLTGDVSGYYEGRTDLVVPPGNVNVSNAEKMNRFFKHCTSLENIPFMDIAFVEELDEFCAGCISLESIATMSYHRAKTMIAAFQDCINLKTLPSMDLDACENICGMFFNSGLEHIGELKGSKITHASELFYGCTALEALPKVDLSKVEDLSGVCHACESITSARIDSSSATNLDNAFYGCTSLEFVDINMDKCTSANNIFGNCPNLDHIVIQGELKVGLDLSQTKINIAAATNIVDNLPTISKPLQIILTGTPGSKISSVVIARAERKGWSIVR